MNSEKSCVRFLVLLALLSVGCSRPNRVSGTVTYDGQPLPAGRVTFLCDGEGRPVLSGTIGPDGAYEIENPPVGRARVSVETFKPQPKPPPTGDVIPSSDPFDTLIPAPWEDVGPYVPIPNRYGSVKTSGLEFLIEPGSQTFDIPLAK